MTKTILLLTLALLPLAFPHPAEARKQEGKPNIVFILADDLGLDGVSSYGSDRFKGKTPNIDKLAQSGTRFTHCYASPLCGPSRCTIMTGRYVFRTGALTNQTAGQPSSKNEPSLPRMLKEAGYATGMAGKWRQMGNTPGDWGFDEWLTDPTAGGWYWKNNYTKNGQPVQTKEQFYGPDVCLDFTRDFLKRNKDKPFFFYYPTHLVHGPILRTPDSAPNKTNFYEDNVAYLDKQVGALVAELERLGLREKTLIVFAGDNGTARFGADQSTLNGRRINGMKGSVLEGGSRVPLIVNGKGVPTGKVNEDLIDFSDFFATCAELTHVKTPTGVTFDSHSFAPQLRGEKSTPRDWVFIQLGPNKYVRERGYKLTGNGELFDMREAPFVEKPVPADSANPEAMAARKRLQAALDQLKSEPAPTPIKRRARKKKKEDFS